MASFGALGSPGIALAPDFRGCNCAAGGAIVTRDEDQTAYVPNAPAVVSETISGETIIMHHGTGHYFDTVGAGTALWEAIAGGGATAAMLTAVLAARRGATADGARAAALGFVATLEQHDLVRALPAPAGMAAAVPGGSAEPFEAPVLGVHTDLADMLLLDPIHDVGEAGWPSLPPLAEPQPGQ